jgi:hypothetical protein
MAAASGVVIGSGGSLVNLILKIMAGIPCRIVWRTRIGNSNNVRTHVAYPFIGDAWESKTTAYSAEASVRLCACPWTPAPSMTMRGHQVDIEGGAAIQTGHGCGTDEIRDSNFNVADLSVAQRKISTRRRGRHRRSSS